MKKTEKSHLIEVQNSGIHGNGLFAVENIEPEELLFIIRGEIIDESEALRREVEEQNVYIFYNGDSFIDTIKTDKIKYINHSCEPNCEVMDGDVFSLKLVAIKPIRKGEELTIDYGYEEIYQECNCNVCSKRKSAL
ncbi:MAG: SET domain-containing protein [Ignavibacteria bacterium]|nr:SET domain-containing protein [Ignavibacteria bacterium]MCU7501463.1 SET domain-containing protein [Ignavibacteria bacterium]MCU7516021.1 SET domain-containing protein [Ignavibacteria bacterium]